MLAPTFWISAGEISGDMHGAKLMEALRKQMPECSFVGMGGPAMREAGLKDYLQSEELSVMGLSEVLSHLPHIFGMLRRTKAALAATTPDALIVIDAPSFHFRVIKIARSMGIPVYYYIGPKAWAWNNKRAIFLRNTVRRLLSILPFEREFYQKYDFAIDYVGNPLMDTDWGALDALPIEPCRIGLLPGSRKREYTRLMPIFAQTAALLQEKIPNLHFHCACAPGVDANSLRALWDSPLPLTIHPPEGRYAFMRQSALILAASGTATLETALVGTPTIVTYVVDKLTWFVGKFFVKVPWVSLPNLIMGRAVFPELLQKDCQPELLALACFHWLDTSASAQGTVRYTAEYTAVRDSLVQLRTMLGSKGVADNAATVIATDLQTLLQSK